MYRIILAFLILTCSCRDIPHLKMSGETMILVPDGAGGIMIIPITYYITDTLGDTMIDLIPGESEPIK